MRNKIKVTINSPVVLVFSFLCVIVLGLDRLTGGGSTRALFSVYRSSLGSVLTYLRFFGHVLGHADIGHLVGNLMYILILGPMLEEKYGTRSMCVFIALTALVTGIFQFVLFPSTALLGASGVAFAMIILASLTGLKEGSIPLTFILVFVLYMGQQIFQMITVGGSISYLSHMIGGSTGAVLGYIMNRK